MNRIITTKSIDPHINLATEELLFEAHKGDILLFLWQNAHTVVIGRNQNAYRECRTELLFNEGGKLARRSTGGGAVYHDLGNLNFTFIAKADTYDVARQLKVIAKAVQGFGIAAEISGRNDITTEGGAKFSGNAFKKDRTTCMHHGTILIDVDMNRLSRYLVPSKEKLASKGVSSVRARVCNLSSLSGDISVSSMKEALMAEFQREYGEALFTDTDELKLLGLDKAFLRHSSNEWCLGGTRPYDIELTGRLTFGELQLRFTTDQGIITDAQVFSDAMDETFIQKLPKFFIGNSIHLACDSLKAAGGDFNEISSFIADMI